VVTRRWLAAAALLAAQSASVLGCAPLLPTKGPVAKKDVTADDLVKLRDIGGFDSSLVELPSPLSLSPDGRRVAFVVSQADPSTNSYCRWLVVQGVRDGGQPTVLDQGGDLPTLRYAIRGYMAEVGYPDTVTPGWSPNGKWIAFLRRDKGVTQLWRVSASGGPAQPVSRSPVDIEVWAWASDDWIVTASRPEQVGELERIDAEGKRGWRYDARFAPNYGSRPRLSGSAQRRYVAMNLATGASREATAGEIALLEPERVQGEPVEGRAVNERGDQAWLAPETDDLLAPSRIRLRDSDGRDVACPAPQCAEGIIRLYWIDGGRKLLFMRREGWRREETTFYAWTPGTAPRRLWGTTDVLLGCLLRGQRFVCLREGPTQPRRLVELDPITGKSRTLFDPNPEFSGFRFGKVERLKWSNDQGLPAWGDLVLPPDYRKGQRIPMVVVQYHSDGFLRGGTGDEYPILPLAARGFAILSVEGPPHIGTILPGIKTVADLSRAATADWAERRSTLSALLKGVAMVVDRGIADPRRIGITGLSDGASTARFALINSRVFSAAAISQASIEPKSSMIYGGIAWADFNREQGFPSATAAGSKFWKPASMAFNAERMDVPLLIQAADDEYLLALEAVIALREKGQPVDMYVYPGEHHIKWQPAHRLAVYSRSIDWFDFWFRHVEDNDPAKAEQYRLWETMRSAMRPTSKATTTPAPTPQRPAGASGGGG
jgi:dipeptidyl aminopeptidase/acylaminoacyl peptidase